MDQKRDELLYSNVKGKNPFKDKRVRQALYQAIDIEAIKTNDDARPVAAVGRDAAVAAAVDARAREAAALRPGEGEEAARRGRLPERLRGDARLPEQPLRQRREDLPGAGGDVGADRRQRSTSTRCRAPTIFRSSRRLDTSMYMLGWGGGADRRASSSCSRCCRAYNGKGDGDYNYGRYTNREARRADRQDQGRHESGRSGSTRSTKRWLRTTPRSTTCRCTGR